MAPNANEITVAANGTISVATVLGGTYPTFPTTARGTLTGGTTTWKEMGYATEDGVTFSVTPDVTDISAWQSATPVRRMVTARTLTVSTSLLQWNSDVFPVVFGGGTVTNTGGTHFTYEPPTDSEALATFAIIVDAEDGTRTQRWVIESANVTDAVETNLVRSGAAVLPVTFNALTRSGQSRAWHFYAGDSEFQGGV